MVVTGEWVEKSRRMLMAGGGIIILSVGVGAFVGLLLHGPS